MASTIHVSNISAQTSEKELKDFLSFCGKISNLSLTPESGSAQAAKSATITFEKESAAKTALLLDGTSLGSNEINVSAGKSLGEISSSATGGASTATEHHDDGELNQEDKPRARVLAEYLASGYKLGDHVLQRGIALDNQHGISSRFTQALQNFDQKTGATARATAVDNKYNISDKATKTAQNAWLGLASYYEKFTGTPTGQRVHSFYTSSEKQVLDIHNEAVRLAGLKTKEGQSGEQHTPHTVGKDVEGKERTKCNCGGVDGVCGCAPGTCACDSCDKSGSAPLGDSTQTATGGADKIAASSNVAPLGEKK